MRSFEQCIDLARKWSENPFFAKSDRENLTRLLESNSSEIEESFYKNLEFGTAGLRSIVGFGPNRMNIYNVKKAAYALAMASKNIGGSKVAVSYDSRNTSLDFSMATAEVCSALGFQVYLVNRPTPTPLLSFFVKELGCDCGVMITASHNPPEYNGFKAYWKSGGQIIPPVDTDISRIYNDTTWETLSELKVDKSKIEYVSENIYEKYFQMIAGESLRKELIQNFSNQLNFLYTPLHGVGDESITKVFNLLEVKNFKTLESQKLPDGNFPTTNYPNPEDPEALVECVKEMHENSFDVTIASDPDADRMGIAIKEDDEVYFPNGNQLAYSMLYYKLLTLSEFDKIPQNPYVVKTIVTSPLQAKICHDFDCEIFDTLTGFKWIGDKIEEKGSEGYIFGSEEAFGSLSHGNIRDKDGVSAGALFLEMMVYLKSKNKTFNSFLSEIYEKYGYHEERLLSFTFEGKQGLEKIQGIMEVLRSNPKRLLPNELHLFDDYQTLKCFDLIKDSATKIDFSHSSNVLKFSYDSGLVILARPSGTEPKIKFYLQFSDPSYNREIIQNANNEIKEIERMIGEFCNEI